MKKWAVLPLAVVMTGTTFLGACSSSGGSDGEQSLDIYCLYKGYQDEWLTSTIELFKQQDWVKEKYPELKVTYTSDGVQAMAMQKLSQGASMNKFDLMFSVLLTDFAGNSSLIADLTDSVYLAEVPGEPGVKVIDKIPDYMLDAMAYEGASAREDGYDTYYNTCYIEGAYGLMYNADILRQLQKEVPVTSDEFIELCKYIMNNGYSYTVDGKTETSYASIMNASENNYWQTSFELWWAQYEGYDEFVNFYKGIKGDERSNEVLQQKGRLRSLETIERLFGEDWTKTDGTKMTGYGYESSNAIDYIVCQTNFLSGNGVFHYNGDYFAMEMSKTMESLKQKGIDYDIKYMKMPVISSIVEKLSYRNGSDYMSDETLQQIIREIDNDVLYEDSTAKTNGVSAEDFAVIAEARRIPVRNSGVTQSTAVPSYSPSKEVAFDFLRFMYTDIAIKNFYQSGEGIMFPVNYDVRQDAGIYNNLNKIQKSKLDLIAGTANYPSHRLPTAESFPLGKAGLAPLTTFTQNFEVAFTVAKDQRTTAEMIYRDEIDYWNADTWLQLVSRAGY